MNPDTQPHPPSPLPPAPPAPASNGPAHTWGAALSELQLQMTKATFDTWLANTRAIAFEDSTLTIRVASAFAKDWLENRLLTTVKRTLVGIVGQPIEVEFAVAQGQGQEPEDSAAQPTTTKEQDAETLGLQPVYLTTRSAIIQPDQGIFVTM